MAGPNRHRTWLYVHALTPTVLRLHPQVVRFLLDALAWLAEPDRGAVRRLPRDPTISYPECVILRDDDRAWLHVFAATPSVVPLAPPMVEFLQDALSGVPSLGHSPVSRPATGLDPRHADAS